MNIYKKVKEIPIMEEDELTVNQNDIKMIPFYKEAIAIRNKFENADGKTKQDLLSEDIPAFIKRNEEDGYIRVDDIEEMKKIKTSKPQIKVRLLMKNGKVRLGGLVGKISHVDDDWFITILCFKANFNRISFQLNNIQTIWYKPLESRQKKEDDPVIYQILKELFSNEENKKYTSVAKKWKFLNDKHKELLNTSDIKKKNVIYYNRVLIS